MPNTKCILLFRYEPELLQTLTHRNYSATREAHYDMTITSFHTELYSPISFITSLPIVRKGIRRYSAVIQCNAKDEFVINNLDTFLINSHPNEELDRRCGEGGIS